MSSYSTLSQRPHTQGNTLHTRLLTTLIRHMKLSQWDLWWIKPIFDKLHPPCIRNIKSNGAHTSWPTNRSQPGKCTDCCSVQVTWSGLSKDSLNATYPYLDAILKRTHHHNIVALSSPPCNSKSCMEKYQIFLGSSTSTRITVQDGGN